MSNGLRQVWDDLLAEALPATGWLTRRVLPGACCTVRAAITSPERMPALLIEVRAVSIGSVVEYPAGAGFSVAVEPIVPGPHGTVRLSLNLTDDRYVDQFAALAEDVMSAINQASTEEAAVVALLSRLRAWQVFLQRHSEGLTLEEQTGLFAELSFLISVCRPLLGNSALDSWKGPLGGMRDFVVGRTGIELKATTSSASATLHISRLGQLDDAGLSRLIVCRTTLSQAETGISLVDLVEVVREQVREMGSAARDQLEQLLFAAGYSDVHAPRYGGRRLETRGRRYFRVGEGFPRLTAGTVPTGIVDASYVIDLASCLPYEITETAALEMISSQ